MSSMTLDDLLEPGSTLRKVADGATWAEGPCWVPAAGVVRWSDIPGDRILQHDPATGETTVHREGVEFTNGRTLRPDGAVVQCSHGLRRVEVEEQGHLVTPVVERWAEGRFNSPNDVVVASDGAVWFTDPPYGIVNPEEGHPGEMEYGGCHVFRVDPQTGEAQPMVTEMGDPNGLAFSPDESVLYVSDTLAARRPGEGNPHHVRAYPVIRDGEAARTGRAVRCGEGWTVFEIAEGVPDGIRVDEAGRIWSSAGDGVHLYAPSGEHLGHLPVPEVVSNLCFGGPDGRDLFITATTGLYHVRVMVRDAAWRG